MNRRLDAVNKEIAEAKAESLGLAGKSLEAALRALKEFDERGAADPDGTKRRALVLRAVERVTNFIVQREANGLRDAEYVYRFYGVPREIVRALGART